MSLGGTQFSPILGLRRPLMRRSNRIFHHKRTKQNGTKRNTTRPDQTKPNEGSQRTPVEMEPQTTEKMTKSSPNTRQKREREIKNIRYVTVLTQKWKVENYLKRVSVSSHNDELSKVTLEGLGGLVSSLLERVLEGRSLSYHIKDGLGECGVSKGYSTLRLTK